MKKNLFFASAFVMGMMSSCSNEVDNMTASKEKLQPVELSLKAPSVLVSPSTKGVGTVGGLATDETANKWNGEKLHVIMMQTQLNGAADWSVSSWSLVEDPAQSSQAVTVENFNNLQVTAPKGAAGGNIVINTEAPGYQPKYYPSTNSRHAFFAYHIDDAAASQAYEPQDAPSLVDDNEAKTRSVYFLLDGTQDLMQGKAEPKSDTPDNDNIAFSAKSARAGIIPELQMKHMLSRFTFQVKGGDNQAQNLKVNKITVTSKYKGNMIVAYQNNPGNLVSFEDETAGFVLKKRTAANTEMSEIATLDALSQDEFVQIGEAMMVAPGEAKYQVEIETTQKLSDGKSTTMVHSSEIVIDPSAQVGVAQVGSSYNVKITLFANQEIKVEAALEGWNNGGDIEVKPGDDL